jgi:DNA-binding LacI/PurR family transcriptional regulator
MRDVARRAGVSIKTVSNVVNGYAHVTPGTRERVEQAISDLGYRPNLTARGLRNGRTGIIALAVPELGVPYFAELSQHVLAAADKRGWTVLIDQTGGQRDRERLVAAGFRDQIIDGLIFSPLALTAADLAERADNTPMVLLGERIGAGGPLVADHVMIDNVAAARDVTAHLIASGRRRVAAIGAQDRASGATARMRLEGYRLALAAAGRPYDPALVAPAERFHRADGAAGVSRLLRLPEPPDAIFCFNDPLALGAIRRLWELGLRVPDDVAVAGFDDIEDGCFSVPTLTTVAPDKAELARRAVDLLARRLADPAGPPPPEEVEVGHRLVVRESTAAPLSRSPSAAGPPAGAG